ncbi:MAG: hypothetical protein H0X17_02715 [Deltaproteobacteria bacterium]|nr:hypothetical protein [Deltaproteobacteria bacterium]
MRSIVPGVLTVTCLLGSAVAETDSLTDLLGPREIAVGEAMRGGATGATAIGMNPAGLPLNRELVFEGGYGYRASDSASLIGVSACDSTNAMPGCFFYDYIGSSPELEGTAGMTGSRRTHLAGMTLSRTLLPRVFIGSTTKYYDHNSDMVGETSTSGFLFDLGATIRVTSIINLGISAQNLFATESSEHFPRAVGGGFHARPIPSLSMSFDMRWKLEGEDQAVRYGGGAELFLTGARAQTGYPIRVGALRDNGTGSTYVSGGLGLTSIKWGLDVAARKEVKGGDETMVLASMRFWGPRMATPGLDGSAME